METILVKMEKENPDAEGIRKAGEIIRAGGLVAFPTETVYGLGGDALNPDSSRKIYAAKGRPSDNPLIVHICRWDDIYKIAHPVPEEAEKLAKAYWPGPLTMILKKTDLVPEETTGGLDTVAIRFPQDPIARTFIEAAGGFVAAPSANLSGKPSPTLAQYVAEDMNGRIEMIIDGGEVGIGLESTIVDLTGEEPMILRPGFITKEMLEEVLKRVEVDRTILDANCRLRPKAPGMRYKHYAPKGDLTIIEGEPEAVTEAICQRSKAAESAGEKVGIIATDETARQYRTFSGAESVKSVGRRVDEAAVGRSLYRILREFDDENVTVIFSESFSQSGFGQAIMNRLLKAAGHHVERV
ncbi:MAG: L-threonylcarbamoyladenylate synthase [Eubacteriales bacterium]|nr:L-threonylcarbamoyladenylate synthase [Eubacteriales bacterium]